MQLAIEDSTKFAYAKNLRMMDTRKRPRIVLTEIQDLQFVHMMLICFHLSFLVRVRENIQKQHSST